MTRAEVIAAETFAQKQRDFVARKFKLIDCETGAEIVLPATRKCHDGYVITITDFQASGSKDMPGKIYTSMNEVYVPSVCGAKIIEFPLNQQELEAAGAGGMRI